MKRLLVLTLLLFSWALAQTSPDLAAFQASLQSLGMTFAMPPGFESVKLEGELARAYDFVIRTPDKKLEIRYQVRSLADDVARYRESKQPGSSVSAADPNKIFAALIMVAVANIGQIAPDPNYADDFPPDAVKREFGADAGKTAAVRIADKEFSSTYQLCLVNILQKNDVAYATTYALGNDPDIFTTLFTKDAVFHALRFK